MSDSEKGGTPRHRLRVVGGDGGGTRLRLALADGAGRVLARRTGPPGLVEPGREGAAAARVAAELTALAAETGAPLPVDALCVGLAGVGRPERARRVQEALVAARVAHRVQVVTDAAVALRDAFGAGPGILLIAGTGSVALARDVHGGVRRTGGWGALLGDEGSGYGLGLGGLRAALRGWEGRGPGTSLSAELVRALGVTTPADFLPWTEGAGKGEVAALAPLVIRSAQEGDRVARELVEAALAALVAHVEALSRPPASGDPLQGAVQGSAGPNGELRLPIALAGGLLSPGGPLRDAILALLTTRGFPVREGPVDAARGGVELALASLSN
ncbi:MAG: hypothetical protein EA422_09300 [Gemmatimonadales bacterium]|nr:MAG: hypothetical protein EA422_09300 [Gemmatimonadales bacterium]